MISHIESTHVRSPTILVTAEAPEYIIDGCFVSWDEEVFGENLQLVQRLSQWSLEWCFVVVLVVVHNRMKDERLIKGKELCHLGGARSRAAAPPHQKGTVEVARASISDASWTSPCGGVPGMPYREENPGHAGETMSLGWPENASGSLWKSWRKCLGRG
ncbi:hypothetical protein QTP70_022607, partial [Hemibagrus guttatus]